MIAEGSETPGEDPLGSPQGGRRTEGDLLAERRARRAAETGETGVIRRAEAAEATVQALETHLASLRQRLEDAELERRRITQLADSERASLAEREHELRRVKQREYAEQQLRVEAEDRRIDLERDSRARVERLNLALLTSQRETRELTGRLEDLQRELAESEHAAAAERSALLADLRAVTERGLETRIAALEGRAEELRRGLDSERAARERAERLLEQTRTGHRRMETLVGELKGVVTRLRSAAAEDAARAREQALSMPTPQEAARAREAEDTTRPGEGEDAARAREAEDAREPAPPTLTPSPMTATTASPPAGPPTPSPSIREEDARRAEMADALAAAVERLRARVAVVEELPGALREPEPALPARQPHKHSRSLITRLRLRRKERRERRSDAARRPTMRS